MESRTMSLRPCPGSPVCPELVRSPDRYCPQHQREKDLSRGTPAERGYDERWARTRERYRRHRLELDGELRCDHCGATEDQLGVSLHVDHLDGLGPNGPRGHDFNNLQLLCPTDHQTKTNYQTNTGGAPA